ncbi:hypothetical protein SPRA44_360047 [Serratia proteamaculans]|nr:hypothetical protein SPRA44_360047 [Serratia proteamaculans]
MASDFTRKRFRIYYCPIIRPRYTPQIQVPDYVNYWNRPAPVRYPRYVARLRRAG